MLPLLKPCYYFLKMSFRRIELNKKSPQIVNAVVEIPRGSHNKYEYDEETGEIRLDRILYSAVFYPTDYGFIPQTRSEDGDHLDIMILVSEPLFPGCVLEVRPIGLLTMADEQGEDDKIIAVANRDPRLNEVSSLDGIDNHLKAEIQNFFEVYKKLEKKLVKVHRWRSQQEAYKVIDKAIEKFQNEEIEKEKN